MKINITITVHNKRYVWEDKIEPTGSLIKSIKDKLNSAKRFFEQMLGG